MSFAKNPQLEEALLQLIGQWSPGDRDGFRAIINNAIDIHVDPEWLVSTLAMKEGLKPDGILTWKKGIFAPAPIVQGRVVDFIKHLLMYK